MNPVTCRNVLDYEFSSLVSKYCYAKSSWRSWLWTRTLEFQAVWHHLTQEFDFLKARKQFSSLTKWISIYKSMYEEYWHPYFPKENNSHLERNREKYGKGVCL